MNDDPFAEEDAAYEELVPEGLPRERLARLVVELPPELADRVRVYLPVVRPASPPAAEPEPPAEPPKVPENVAVASVGSVRFESHPPVMMQWPDPRPESVPAVAPPLPALPSVPEALAGDPGVDDEVARVDAHSRDEWLDYFGKGNPFVNPSYPVLTTGYRVWDDLGRDAQFREGGMGQSNEASPTGWDISHRHVVTRVRYHRVGRAP